MPARDVSTLCTELPRRALGRLRRQALVAIADARAGGRASGIALTFDDGPHEQFTPALLDVLAEADVGATFFVRGDAAVALPSIVRRIRDDGHVIGSHTMTHPDFRRSPFVTVRQDVALSRDVLAAITGTPIKLIRPPHGRLTARTAWHLRRAGWSTRLWDIDAHDWKASLSAEAIAANVTAAADGDVVLMHDTHDRVADVTRAAIDGLRARGAHFVTLAPTR